MGQVEVELEPGPARQVQGPLVVAGPLEVEADRLVVRVQVPKLLQVAMSRLTEMRSRAAR